MMHPVTVTSPRNGEKGFTLVEMSIVLVIIGLIIGGVLVGQDLIRQAETTALIGQIQEYDTAMHTFKTKYGTLPGDLPNATNVLPTNAAISLSSGDGNGFLSDAMNVSGGGSASNTGFASPTTTGGEIAQVWAHLSVTGMIEGLFVGGTAITVTLPVAGAASANFPSLKTGRGGIVAYGEATDAFNYYWVGLQAGTFGTTANLRPDEAFGIDKKLDDGLPTTGNVMGSGSATIATTGWLITSATKCYNTSSGGASIYITNSTSYECQVRVKMN